MAVLVDIRCPLRRKDGSGKPCNALCVRVVPGSSGQAYCRRCEQNFDFHVDDNNSFSGIILTREAKERQ